MKSSAHISERYKDLKFASYMYTLYFLLDVIEGTHPNNSLKFYLHTCTLQKIKCYFPTNIGVFLSQIVHPHHISEVKHIDGYS